MNEKYRWFREAGLGMFIHWGVYAVPGRGEWAMQQEQIPLEEYDRHIPEFTAANYDPDDWARLAANAGMRYMVLTAKHHDGFCLFDTATTHRNAVRQGPRRDLVRDYVKACRRHGLKVGLYFSWPDWSHPGANLGPDRSPKSWAEYIDFTHAQVRELCSNYGRIDLLWYDKAPNMNSEYLMTPERLRALELNAMVRQLQPGIILNDRSLLPEDFYTAEQNTRAPDDPHRLWESCLTMNKHWGYFPADNQYKPISGIIHELTGVATFRGNMLLNVGPAPDGSLRQPERERLEALGKWMTVNGEAVRNVAPSPLSGATYGCAAARDNDTYLYVHWWHRDRIAIPNCDRKFSSGIVLGTDHEVRIRHDGKHLVLSGLPQNPPDPFCPVIKLRNLPDS